MQITELFRRGIVVPLDSDAEEALRNGDVDATTNVQHLIIPDNGLFERLWRIGLFSEINAQCGSMVDDYEEDFIEAPSVAGIRLAIDVIERSPFSRSLEVAKFLEDMRALVELASMGSHPVVFVL